jgi:hypothetical protein
MSTSSVLAECELTGLKSFQCAHGLGTLQDDVDPVRASLLQSLSAWVRADHPGRCVACGQPFPEGAAILAARGGWRADCCPRSGLMIVLTFAFYRRALPPGAHCLRHRRVAIECMEIRPLVHYDSGNPAPGRRSVRDGSIRSP